MKRPAALLLALLLTALVSDSTAASVPRRILLDAFSDCQEQCTEKYEDNVQKCISDTKMGEPPMTITKAAHAHPPPPSMKYTPPKKTAFNLAEQQCRELQQEEYTKCKNACVKKPDCDAVKQKCDKFFDQGSLLAAWCRAKEGC
jgi:hypothetical protein